MFGSANCCDLEQGKKQRGSRTSHRELPEGWSTMQWDRMSKDEQVAIKHLGWNESSWKHGNTLPLQDKPWDELNADQRKSLEIFRITQDWWDSAYTRKWDSLTTREQNAALQLGYSRPKWEQNSQMQFQFMKWGELKNEQQNALKVFKFNQESWDRYIAGNASEADPLIPNRPARPLYHHGEKVVDCPDYSKQAFIKAAFIVPLVLLVIAFLVSFPFMRDPAGALEFFSSHSWIIIIVAFIWVIQILIYLAVLLELKWYADRADHVLLDGYVRVLGPPIVDEGGLAIEKKAWPCMLYAFIFTICSSMLIASGLAAFSMTNICIVYLYTAFIVLGLYFWMWWYQLKANFLTMWGYCVPVASAIILALFTHWFMTDPTGLSIDRIIALFLAVGFGWIMVFDTQLIYGAKHDKGRKYPYHVDQWCFAGYEMYFDFFFFCLQSGKLLRYQKDNV